MGFLSRLFSGRSSDGVDAVLLEGDETVEVVGEASYQPAIRSACGSSGAERVRHECLAALVPEPRNPYDPNAVRVVIAGATVGYLSRGDAIDYGPAVRAFGDQGKLIAANAVIAGRGAEGSTRNMGVFLVDFPGPTEALGLARL